MVVILGKKKKIIYGGSPSDAFTKLPLSIVANKPDRGCRAFATPHPQVSHNHYDYSQTLVRLTNVQKDVILYDFRACFNP